MNSRDEEIRNQLLDADPDGITWHVQGSDGKPRAPLAFTDSMISVLGRFEGFKEMLARRVRTHIDRAAHRSALGTVDAQAAVVEAMTEVLGPLNQRRASMMSTALGMLGQQGVPREALTPQNIAQDWGASSLTDAGALVLRLRAAVRKGARAYAEVEREYSITIRRDGLRIEVKP